MTMKFIEPTTRDFISSNGSILIGLARLANIGFELYGSRLSETARAASIDAVISTAVDDLHAYHSRDPSVRSKPIECLLSVHSTYFAVLCYRIAHQLLAEEERVDLHVLEAMHLSFAARTSTGVEIHPEAVIGQRLVVDHGWGTVIGQTVEIGDDAYLLNNVTLGGRVVANAPDGKRHPTLGHRVQVCAGARVFGPIVVGDDSFVGPDITVISDVPPGSTLLSTLRPVQSPGLAASPYIDLHSASLEK